MNAVNGEDCPKFTVKVNPFNDLTLKKCKEISEFRRQRQYRYKEITIPSDINFI